MLSASFTTSREFILLMEVSSLSFYDGSSNGEIAKPEFDGKTRVGPSKAIVGILAARAA